MSSPYRTNDEPEEARKLRIWREETTQALEQLQTMIRKIESDPSSDDQMCMTKAGLLNIVRALESMTVKAIELSKR